MISPHALYRYFDAGDRLLYAGKSGDVTTRLGTHVRKSDWMQFAARSTIERFPTSEELASAEREAIVAERPVFNRQHNETPGDRRRLLAYLEEAGRPDLMPARLKAVQPEGRAAGERDPRPGGQAETATRPEELAVTIRELHFLPPLEKAKAAWALKESAAAVLAAEAAEGMAGAVAAGMTQAAVAKALGIVPSQVSLALKMHGLPRGKTGRPPGT